MPAYVRNPEGEIVAYFDNGTIVDLTGMTPEARRLAEDRDVELRRLAAARGENQHTAVNLNEELRNIVRRGANRAAAEENRAMEREITQEEALNQNPLAEISEAPEQDPMPGEGLTTVNPRGTAFNWDTDFFGATANGLTTYGEFTARRAGTRIVNLDALAGTAHTRQTNEDDDSEAITQEVTPGNAIAALNNHYRMNLDKKGKFLDAKTEVVVKEPDPVNDNEEVILNYCELADTLAKEVLTIKYGVYDEVSMVEEYSELVTSFEDIIKNHKRKINA